MTPQEVKDHFRARGESAAGWADKNGYDRAVVYRVLNGRSACWRGKPHEVAVALGIKPDPAKTRV